jgi:hypothetical protein
LLVRFDFARFRTSQTAVVVPYMLREGAWLANVVPIFGEPWIVPFEFPFHQWCVALLTWTTGSADRRLRQARERVLCHCGDLAGIPSC